MSSTQSVLSHFLAESSRKRMPHTDANAMNSSTENQVLMREEEVNRFRETQEIFDKFFKWLYGLIAFKNTPIGEALFIAHPNAMVVVVSMIVLYFLLWLLGTMLPRSSGIYLIILVCIMMVIASVSSVLVLALISSLLAWFSVLSWVCIFALTAYFCYQELYKLVACVLSDTIKQLIDGYRTQSARSPV